MKELKQFIVSWEASDNNYMRRRGTSFTRMIEETWAFDESDAVNRVTGGSYVKINYVKEL